MIQVIGYILQFMSGLFGLGIFIGILVDWLGFFGYFVWPLLSPGIIVFPFIFWMVEGHLPQLYLLMWGLGVIGTGITMIGRAEHEI